MGIRGMAAVRAAALLVACLLVAVGSAAERAAESKYSPGNATLGRGNGSRRVPGLNMTRTNSTNKAPKGVIATKLTSLSLLCDDLLPTGNKTAAVASNSSVLVMKAQRLVASLEKTAPCLETAIVVKLHDTVEALDDAVADSAGNMTAEGTEDPRLEKTAKMARIVKFLAGKTVPKCNGTVPAKDVLTVKKEPTKPPRNKTSEILTLRRYMAFAAKLNSSRLLKFATNSTMRKHMYSVEHAMIAVGAEKLNSTQKRQKVLKTVRQLADEYGVNNDSSTVEEVAESLYDKEPPPPPPKKPDFPEGFNETMVAVLRNMSKKADQSDNGVVPPEAEDEEANKLSGVMGKMTAVQMAYYMPKMADAQKAVAMEDRRLMAMKLKIELACKNKTKPAVKPTVNITSAVRRFIFNITGQTHLPKKYETELQGELSKVNTSEMDKDAEKELENLVMDLKEENRTIELENNRTAAANNASKAAQKAESEKPKSVKPVPVVSTSIFGSLFGRR